MLIPALLINNLSYAQESRAPISTADIQDKIEKQVSRNESELKSAIDAADTTEAASMEFIDERAGRFTTPGVRDLTPAGMRDIPVINIALRPDATMRVRDTNNNIGLILTGKWIKDYARMIKIVPEYEKTLASYRSQADVHKQLIAELEGMIGVKDKKINILEEMQTAQKDRANLYKLMAEAKSTPWYEKIWNKLAFPVGLAAGTYLGVKIANNN